MEPDPSERTVESEISADGVDDSQILWMLSLTPAERLQVLQDILDGNRAIEEGWVLMDSPEP